MFEFEAQSQTIWFSPVIQYGITSKMLKIAESKAKFVTQQISDSTKSQCTPLEKPSRNSTRNLLLHHILADLILHLMGTIAPQLQLYNHKQSKSKFSEVDM